MSDQKITQKLLTRLMLPDPNQLSTEELRQLFIEVSRKFIIHLEEGHKIEDLQDLLSYLRSILLTIKT
jgi:hypothetical protein